MRGNLTVLAPTLDLPSLFGVDPDGGWRADALCAQADPEEFFPEIGGSTAAVKRICAACPVRTECLTFALDHNEAHGVWGGLSEPERHRLKRRGVA